MSRAWLAAIVALTLVPATAGACCDLDQQAPAQSQQASAEPSCPLHSHGAPEKSSPRHRSPSPAPCPHDLSIDGAGLVRTVVTSAPRASMANATPALAPQARLAPLARLAPSAPFAPLAPDTSRPLVLRI